MEIFKSNKSVLDYIASQSDTYSSEDFEKVWTWSWHRMRITVYCLSGANLNFVLSSWNQVKLWIEEEQRERRGNNYTWNDDPSLPVGWKIRTVSISSGLLLYPIEFFGTCFWWTIEQLTLDKLLQYCLRLRWSLTATTSESSSCILTAITSPVVRRPSRWWGRRAATRRRSLTRWSGRWSKCRTEIRTSLLSIKLLMEVGAQGEIPRIEILTMTSGEEAV